AEQEKDTFYIADIHLQLGSIYFAMGNFLESLKSFQTSLKFYRKLGFITNVIYTDLAISDTYIKLKRFLNARSVIEESIMLSRSINFKSGLQYGYEQLSAIDSISGNYKLAF